MFVLLAIQASAAPPVGGRLTLDASGAFQSYDYQSGWLDTDEQAFREELRATFNGYLLDRAFANYKLGVAVDSRTLFSGEDESSTRFGYAYDGRVNVWQRGTVPVTLYASHQTGIPQIESSPSNQSTSDIYGYKASLLWRGLPKVDTSGRYQVLQSTSDGITRRQEITNLRAGIFEASKNNHARGSVDWETVHGPTEGSSRDRRRASLDVDARLNDDIEVVARTDAHRYQTTIGDETFTLGNTSSDALIRFRSGDDTTGVAFIEQHQSELDDARYDGVGTGGQLAHRFGKGFRTEVDLGGTWDSVEEPDNRADYVGEYARGSLNHSASGGWGTYDATAQTGVAHYAEVDVTGGLQAGGSLQANYGRYLGTIVRTHVGGEVSGQVDGSGLDQSFTGWGVRGGFTTRSIYGLTIGADASGTTIDVLDRDEGDSTRIRTNGWATMRVAAFLTANYSLNYERLTLDDEGSEGLGHVAQVDLEITGTLSFAAVGYQTRWVTSSSLPTEWWRVEGIGRWTVVGIAIEGRVSRDLAIVQGEERASTKVLVTASRRFGWDL